MAGRGHDSAANMLPRAACERRRKRDFASGNCLGFGDDLGVPATTCYGGRAEPIESAIWIFCERNFPLRAFADPIRTDRRPVLPVLPAPVAIDQSHPPERANGQLRPATSGPRELNSLRHQQVDRCWEAHRRQTHWAAKSIGRHDEGQDCEQQVAIVVNANFSIAPDSDTCSRLGGSAARRLDGRPGDNDTDADADADADTVNDTNYDRWPAGGRPHGRIDSPRAPQSRPPHLSLPTRTGSVDPTQISTSERLAIDCSNLIDSQKCHLLRARLVQMISLSREADTAYSHNNKWPSRRTGMCGQWAAASINRCFD